MRPAWMIRAGLFLYDHLARREVLPGSRGIDLRSTPAGAPLKPQFTRGFVYSDGWVDDARLVVLNALDARERGATMLTRWRCTDAQRAPTAGTATLQMRRTARRTVQAARWSTRPARGPRLPARRRAPARGEALATKSCGWSRAATSS
jgi:glycerol-3-phosphate dehydrogenase